MVYVSYTGPPTLNPNGTVDILEGYYDIGIVPLTITRTGTVVIRVQSEFAGRLAACTCMSSTLNRIMVVTHITHI